MATWCKMSLDSTNTIMLVSRKTHPKTNRKRSDSSEIQWLRNNSCLCLWSGINHGDILEIYWLDVLSRHLKLNVWSLYSMVRCIGEFRVFVCLFVYVYVYECLHVWFYVCIVRVSVCAYSWLTANVPCQHHTTLFSFPIVSYSRNPPYLAFVISSLSCLFTLPHFLKHISFILSPSPSSSFIHFLFPVFSLLF